MRLTILFFLIIKTSFIFSQSEAIGKWIAIDDKTNVRKSVVEIYEKNGKYHGKVVKLIYRDQDWKCDRCVGDLKDEPVVGMDILWNMEYRKRYKDFSSGTILNPESGKTYDGKIWVEDGKLMVRGYLMFFYRTQTWLPYKGE